MRLTQKDNPLAICHHVNRSTWTLAFYIQVSEAHGVQLSVVAHANDGTVRTYLPMLPAKPRDYPRFHSRDMCVHLPQLSHPHLAVHHPPPHPNSRADRRYHYRTDPDILRPYHVPISISLRIDQLDVVEGEDGREEDLELGGGEEAT